MKDLFITFNGKEFFIDDVLILEETIVNRNISIMISEINKVKRKGLLFSNTFTKLVSLMLIVVSIVLFVLRYSVYGSAVVLLAFIIPIIKSNL